MDTAALETADPSPAKPVRRSRRRVIVLTILALFILPVAARAAIYAYQGGSGSWRTADWSSIGSLPPASQHPEARVLVLSGRTGGLKGAVAVHSWVVVKAANAATWRRYDVVGWGNPVRTNNWAPDGRWYGDRPHVVVDVKGADADSLVPKIDAAIKEYRFANAGDYRLWPGPNSNTFVATVLRAIPEARITLPPNAIGRDFRPLPYAGLTDSGTGLELNLWGVLGLKVAWVEGIELNFAGLVAGVDLRNPGLKIPGFGRIGFDGQSATAAGL